MTSTFHKILVAGVRVGGSGYPNAERTIDALNSDSRFEVTDIGVRLPENVHLWSIASRGRLRLIPMAVRVIVCNMVSLGRVLRRGRAPLVYVPYPSLPFLGLVRLLPRGVRPRCIADAYISVWDSAFRDRGASVSRSSFASTFVRWLEGWCLRGADVVVVDTEANRNDFSRMLGVEPGRLVSFPLAIDTAPFLRKRRSCSNGSKPSTVLFIGTLIPLHGIDRIIRAADILARRSDIRFRFVGDGQCSGLLEEAIERGVGRIEWRRDWCTLDELSDHVSAASVCLGVFGGKGKAERVLPFKLYYYMASGSPVISQSPMSCPENTPAPPILTVDALQEDPAVELAAHIERLVDSPEEQMELSNASSIYFDQHLSVAALCQRWFELLSRLEASVSR